MKKLFIALCLFVLASCAGHEAPREFRIFNSAGEAILFLYLDKLFRTAARTS